MWPRIIAFNILFAGATIGFAQHRVFEHRMLNPAASIAALSGLHGATQLGAIYRNQWPGNPINHHSTQFAIDGQTTFLKSGYGINFSINSLSNLAHYYSSRSIAEAYFAPKFQIGKGHILTGVSLNYSRHAIKLSPNLSGDRHWLNAGVSLGYLKENFLITAQSAYIASSLPFFHKINSHQLQGSYNPLPMHHSFYASYHFHISNSLRISPSLYHERISTEYSDPRTAISLNAKYKKIMAGVSYLWTEGFAARLGYFFEHRFLVSYAYSLSPNYFETQMLGSHELVLRMTLFKDKHPERHLYDVPLF